MDETDEEDVEETDEEDSVEEELERMTEVEELTLILNRLRELKQEGP